MFAAVVYTNEKNFPIVKLFIDEYIKHTSEQFKQTVKLYVVANNVPEEYEQYLNTHTFIQIVNATVPYDVVGRQFSKTLRVALREHIHEDYILWFCDDYLLTDTLEEDRLQNLLHLVKDSGIDMFTFASIPQHVNFIHAEQLPYNQYKFENERFYYVDNGYMHKFSVQPCIWKRSSLLDIAEANDISLHDMDCSNVLNGDRYTVVCTPYRIYDSCPTCPQKFIMSYIEVIRHGVFILQQNGQHKVEPYMTWLTDYIVRNGVHLDDRYARYFGFDASTLQMQ